MKQWLVFAKCSTVTLFLGNAEENKAWLLDFSLRFWVTVELVFTGHAQRSVAGCGVSLVWADGLRGILALLQLSIQTLEQSMYDRRALWILWGPSLSCQQSQLPVHERLPCSLYHMASSKWFIGPSHHVLSLSVVEGNTGTKPRVLNTWSLESTKLHPRNCLGPCADGFGTSIML